MTLEKAEKMILAQAERLYDLEKRYEDVKDSRDFWMKEAKAQTEQLKAAQKRTDQTDSKPVSLSNVLSKFDIGIAREF